HVSNITALAYNRNQELEADNEAIQALLRRYGHLSGSVTLFQILQLQKEVPLEPPEFFSTHPLTESRLERLSALAQSSPGGVTPLPPNLMTSINCE
ncbi:MAG: M48 family metalloprotease, partial [Gammaproteobacteria bacterium]